MAEYAESGRLTARQKKEYFAIDTEITKAMLSAERKLPKKRRSDWSIELKRLVYRIRYFKLLLQKTRGNPITEKVLNKVGRVAESTLRVSNEGEIRKHLKEAWNALVQFKKKAEEERDKFLLECLTAKEKETDKTQTAAIEAIKRKEKARRRYRKIRKVLNRLKADPVDQSPIPIGIGTCY